MAFWEFQLNTPCCWWVVFANRQSQGQAVTTAAYMLTGDNHIIQTETGLLMLKKAPKLSRFSYFNLWRAFFKFHSHSSCERGARGSPAELTFEPPLLSLVTFQFEGLHAASARPIQSGIFLEMANCQRAACQLYQVPEALVRRLESGTALQTRWPFSGVTSLWPPTCHLLSPSGDHWSWRKHIFHKEL